MKKKTIVLRVIVSKVSLSLFVELKSSVTFGAWVWQSVLVGVCHFYMSSNISFERCTKITSSYCAVVYVPDMRLLMLFEVSYTHKTSSARFTKERGFLIMYHLMDLQLTLESKLLIAVLTF